jgi:ribosomal protein S18 acetylase RimI-like enzyme
LPTPPPVRSRRRSDPTAITIRPASLLDVDVIVRFRLELLREHDRHAIYGRLREDAPDRAKRSVPLRLASGREITYLAFEGKTPIGMLRILECKGSPLLAPSRFAYIASAFVVRSHRRRGILKKLVDAAMTWVRARGLTEVRLHSVPDNPAANAAWESFGFETVELLRRRDLSRVRHD